MNYTQHYDALMARAVGRVLDCYVERHHVIPRCIGGGNESENLVDLTPEEHYVAHQLLAKMYPSVEGLLYAASMMAMRCTGRRAYGWLRRRHAILVSKLHKGVKRRPFTAEHRARLSVAHKGLVLPDEQKKKISNSMRGRTQTAAHRKNNSKAKRGKPMSAATRAAALAANTGSVRTAEHKAAIGAAWRGKKRPPRTPEHTANQQASAARNRAAKLAAAAPA